MEEDEGEESCMGWFCLVEKLLQNTVHKFDGNSKYCGMVFQLIGANAFKKF